MRNRSETAIFEQFCWLFAVNVKECSTSINLQPINNGVYVNNVHAFLKQMIHCVPK